jgi:hypothetical protein
MAGYIFRARRVFTIEELTALEGVYIEDLDPSAPIVGTGSGVVCVVGEFDDGPIATLTEIEGGDITRQFGSLGYTYSGITANNPCARRRNGEVWNGNGFLYTKFIRAPRMLVVRVDSSVGEVAFSPMAMIKGTKGPYNLAVGQQLAVTSSQGGPASSTAIAAAEAQRVGSAPIVATGFVGGEKITIKIDANAVQTVTFAASDQLAADVVSRINNTVGAIVATQSAGTVTVKGLQKGTGGALDLQNVTAGALAALFLTGGVTAGTGNVANLQVVTPAEIATIINGTAALNSIDVKALVDSSGLLAVYDNNPATGTINITSGAMAIALGLSPLGTTVKAGEHAGGTIKAGTRVRTAGGLEWVTMETITAAAGTNAAPNVGPHTVKVRPAFDDGNALGASANAANVLVDQPTFATMVVTNPAALSVALTEGQLDAAYTAAIDKTSDSTGPAIDINYLYSARRSFAIDVYATDNAELASNTGLAGRKYIRSGALGITKAAAKTDCALLRSDRVFYTWPGWQVIIPEIQARGASGGLGFADSGIVTLRAQGALTKINALLPPEENPGQQTGLLTNFFAVENLGFVLTADDYKDLKANGICAPRVDRTAGSIFQSGVTTDLTQARKTQARRKMADFIQDSIARALVVFVKKLSTDARRDAAVTATDGFLVGLQSEQDPERQRIASFSLDSVTPNTPDLEALGIFAMIIKVRTLSSMDAIELRTEIGEGVVTITEAA